MSALESRNILSASFGIALSGVLFAQPVFAQPQLPMGVEEVGEKAAEAVEARREMLRISEDAHRATLDVRRARLAIFNGQTEDALTFTQAALANLDEALAEMDKLAVETKKPAPSGDSYIPFDSSLLLAEGFVPSDDKARSISEANGHLANGDQDKAIAALKVAEIDLTISAALLPAKASRAHVAEAVDLIRDGKFYEANLALKAVEDSVIVESYGIESLPQQVVGE